jgi:ABC-2 type transport system permease protein
MFRRISWFESLYQASSPVFWATAIVLFFLAFASVAIPQIQIGSGDAVLINAPMAVVQTMALMAVFGMFIMTAFAANAVIRDDETRFGQIIHATPIRKFDYLFGRFAGACLAGMAVFLAVPLGMLVGAWMPWLDPARLGPVRPLDYLYAYLFFAAPTLFLFAAMFFALATATRSALATYLGVVAFLMLNSVLSALPAKTEFDRIIGMFEPFGLGALFEATKTWSAADRNTMLPPLSGIILYNRLVWCGAAVGLLAVAYALFRFEAKSARDRRPAPPDSAPPPQPVSRPSSADFAGVGLRQTWERTLFELAWISRSPAFLVLLGLGFISAASALWFADIAAGGFTIFPVTRVMIDVLRGSFALIPAVVSLYYAGELVWRDRDGRISEIVDASPVSDWSFVLPKIAALLAVQLVLFAASIAAAVAVQSLKGYHAYELGHYALWYLVPQTTEASAIAVLAIFAQAISPNKYIGWGLMALYVVVTWIAPDLGYGHHLYLYGTAPDVPLSDMNGQGAFWIGRAWFDLYWNAAAALLAVLAYALWPRGKDIRFRNRLARLPHRLSGSAGVALAIAFCAMVASGSYIYYNTNVENPYRTSLDDDRFKAAYERALSRFKRVPEPSIFDVKLNVAIDPHHARLVTTGSYRIQNRSPAALATVHIGWSRDLRMDHLAVEGARPVADYGAFHYRIFSFDTPMRPGEIRRIAFQTTLEQRGFRNSGNMTAIVDNGTYVDHSAIVPLLGIDRHGLLQDAVKRRRYDLPPEPLPPKLEDVQARAYSSVGHDSGRVTTDLTVSTAADQIPLAPGRRIWEATAGGRRTARFRSDAPIADFYAIQSADYAVRRDKWRDVDLEVYYHPPHGYNVARMIQAMKASLALYSPAFGPYPFHQARIVEVPAFEEGADSFADTVPYSEGEAFIADSAATEPDETNPVDATVIREMAHRWWADQIMAADMQGSRMLSETFTQYSVLLAAEHLPRQGRIPHILRHALDDYLHGRRNAQSEELPLERAESSQSYIYDGKGALVMYRLQQAMGEAVVNAALREFLDRYRFKPAPYPSAADFVTILRREAGPKFDPLIADLFEKVTLYRFRLRQETYGRRADGKIDLALTVEAHKYYDDGKGRLTEAAMDEEVPVGAFRARPDAGGFADSDVLALRALRIHSGTQILHILLDHTPAFAAIDPYGAWIEREPGTNIAPISGARSGRHTAWVGSPPKASRAPMRSGR